MSILEEWSQLTLDEVNYHGAKWPDTLVYCPNHLHAIVVTIFVTLKLQLEAISVQL